MKALIGWVRRRSVSDAGSKTCAWLYENREGFAIHADADAVPIPGNELPWRVKPIFELVLFLALARTWAVKDPYLVKLNAFAIAEIASFDWHELARFDPAAGAPLATLAEFCDASGVELPFDRDYLSSLSALGFFDGMDRMPYREMELLHSNALLNGVDNGPQIAQAFALTSFSRGQLICRYSLDDVYLLTHALFYLTNFGEVPVGSHVGDEAVARVREHLIALVVIMLRIDNADILGELLICWYFCRFHAQPTSATEQLVVSTATERFLAQMAQDGSVPPTWAIREKMNRGTAGFVDVYHTTLVAAILFHLIAK